MTVTEEKPEVGALVATTDAGEEEPPPRPAPRGFAGALGTADHKVVGRLYLAVALVLLGASLVLAVLVGVEGMDLSSLNVLSSETFFQIYTLSRVGIVFLGVLPALLGLAIYIVPLQVGASAVAFPRTAAASFWGWLLGAGLMVGGYAINGGPGGGRVEGVLLSYAAWIMVIISLLAGVVCVVTTVLSLRPEGMSLRRVPTFAWSMLVAGSIWILTLPVLAGNLLLIYVDSDHSLVSFGVPLDVWPQLRWIFVQPAVFALAIPVLGIAGDVVPVMARHRVKAHDASLISIGLFGALSFGPWAQTAFNPALVEQAVYIGMSFLIVLPTLIFFGGLADTLRRGRPRGSAALPLAMLAMLGVLAAAIAAAANAFDPLDLQGTTWGDGVANLLFGSTLVGLAAGLTYWGPKIWGRAPSEALAKLNVLVLLGGAALFGAGELIGGGVGQTPVWPTGTPEFVERGGEVGFGLEALGAALLVLGIVLVILAHLPAAFGRGRRAAADPWDGHTLEWATSSPPAYQNFESTLPLVTSPCPLLDATQADTTDGTMTDTDVTESAEGVR